MLLVHHITVVGSLAVTLTRLVSLQALFRFITGTLFPYSRTMEARPLISLSKAALFNVSGRAPCHCPMARRMSGTASLEHREFDVRASDWQRYAPIMGGPAVPAVSLTSIVSYMVDIRRSSCMAAATLM